MTSLARDSLGGVSQGLLLTPMHDAARGDDAVTASRREMNFAFGEGEVGRLHTVLELNAQEVRFGPGNLSHVHSIYFDDDRLGSCRESLDGVSRRTKVRLRWYDQPMAGETVFFELKHRRGYNVSKRRVPLRLGRPLGSIPYQELADRLLDVLDEECAFWLRTRRQPVVLVSYKRRHFRDPLSGVRLTLDWDLACCEQLGLARPSTRFPRGIRSMTLVEAKAGEVDEARVRGLLFPLRPRLTRNSKYVQCCMSLGWRTIQD